MLLRSEERTFEEDEIFNYGQKMLQEVQKMLLEGRKKLLEDLDMLEEDKLVVWGRNKEAGREPHWSMYPASQ